MCRAPYVASSLKVMCLSKAHASLGSAHASPPLWENGLLRLCLADFCSWPGYLILRLKGPERSLGQLDAVEAAAFGQVLASCARLLERVAKAERVYLLSFAEVDRQLHVHLLARTAALAAAWRVDTGGAGGSVDGPALFQWVREKWPAGTRPPVEPGLAELEVQLRRAVAETGLA